jgi:hypothetical protein
MGPRSHQALTPEEKADIADAVEPLEKAAAKERQGERTDIAGISRKKCGKIPHRQRRHQGAKLLGVDEKTIRNDTRNNSAQDAEKIRTGSAATKARSCWG